MIRQSPAVSAALKSFEGLYPEQIELSLGRIDAALERLGRPQDRLPATIHVAGTNGKGSTCAYLRAMAEVAGLKVHVFTSPHLVRFNERIRLAGDLVEDRQLVRWLKRTRDAIGDQPITPFEATTAAALLAFSEVPADILILEVGLGGRFDATNVITQPAISVITPVDYDHKQFLGTRLEQIAAEKAGIIKRGCPVVSAFQAASVAKVISETAAAQSAPLTVMGRDDLDGVPEIVALPGAHQRSNAGLAGLALRTLEHPAISRQSIWEGAKTATWPARMQQLAPGPLTKGTGAANVWLDGGHNPHAAHAVADVLRQMGGGTALVTAMMASKDHGGFFKAFQGPVDAVYTVPNAPGHDGASPEDLARAAALFLPNVHAHTSFEAGLKAAAASGIPRILICGSLYLAGEVLALNDQGPV